MWGQDSARNTFNHRIRIIPTRVGTRMHRSDRPFQHANHPHACGDKEGVYGSVSATVGSSPRVWGQVERESDSPLDPRIIPTRVGTRYRVCNSGDISEDHPHACGDKISNNRCFVSSTGSSPCVWGQVPASIGARINCRIIPTRVGTRLTH